MTLPLRILIQSIVGIAIGLSLVVLAAAAALVVAFATSSRVAVPAVIDVWTSQEANGSTALEFVPDPAGAGVVILAFAACYAIANATAGVRRSAQPDHSAASRG